MKYFMSLKSFMFSALLILLSFSYSYADDFIYPNSDDFLYPEYEVKFIKDFKCNLEKVSYEADKKLDDNILIEYVLKFKFDIDSNKNKFYTIFIINSLADELENNTYDMAKNEIAKNFILHHETSNDYSDNNIWNKFLTWIIMRNSIQAKLDSYFLKRRKALLNNIIRNNHNYSSIASYLLYEIEGLWPIKCSTEKIHESIENYKNIIAQNPNSEIAGFASVLILSMYVRYSKEYNKAIEQSKEIITKYKNFYYGTNDLYFDTYVELIEMYKQQNDKDKVIFFLRKLNKNAEDYQRVNNFYLSHLIYNHKVSPYENEKIKTIYLKTNK